MPDRVFTEIWELKEHIGCLERGIERYTREKLAIECNVRSMSRRLEVRLAELARRERQAAQDKVDAAQRELDGVIVCPACGAVDGRCTEPDGTHLPAGKIHNGRALAAAGIDCMRCKRNAT